MGHDLAYLEDTELIGNFLNGDINSFNRLVLRWQKRLYNFSYRYLTDEEQAKEVVQLALIKAYKNLKKLKNRERFSSWIFQITVNLCKDNLKQNSRKRHTELSDEVIQNEGEHLYSSNGITDRNNPMDILNQQDLGNIIKRTLTRLPEEQRIVIIMKEYEGFKFAEISEMLNVPINTVKSRMYYGLTQMQKILKKLNIDREVIFNEV